MNQSSTRSPQITPEFLNVILEPVIGVEQATVVQVRQEKLAGRERFNADLRRLYLTYDRRSAAAPGTLIAKLPTANAKLNRRAATFQPGARENWFYRARAARSPVHTPPGGATRPA